LEKNGTRLFEEEGKLVAWHPVRENGGGGGLGWFCGLGWVFLVFVGGGGGFVVFLGGGGGGGGVCLGLVVVFWGFVVFFALVSSFSDRDIAGKTDWG